MASRLARLRGCHGKSAEREIAEVQLRPHHRTAQSLGPRHGEGADCQSARLAPTELGQSALLECAAADTAVDSENGTRPRLCDASADSVAPAHAEEGGDGRPREETR